MSYLRLSFETLPIGSLVPSRVSRKVRLLGKEQPLLGRHPGLLGDGRSLVCTGHH